MPRFGKRSRRARWKDRKELKRWSKTIYTVSSLWMGRNPDLAVVKLVNAEHTPRTSAALEDYLEEQRKLVVKPKPVRMPVRHRPPLRKHTKKERISS
jgi:hypothetical protein